jgi:hypothetical protein
VILFNHDETGYLQWIAANPEGFQINCQRNTVKPPYKAHTAHCTTFKSRVHFTNGSYFKICGTNLQELRAWVRKKYGIEVPDCGTCKPSQEEST